MTGDHIVLPTEGTDQYPYTEDSSFSRPSSAPFLDTMTTLSYVAACTSRIRIGSTVVILPYRNPIVQAKGFASLDVRSEKGYPCALATERLRMGAQKDLVIGLRRLGKSSIHDTRLRRNLEKYPGTDRDDPKPL